MRSIYGAAQKVLIYLGEENPLTILGLVLLDKIRYFSSITGIDKHGIIKRQELAGLGFPSADMVDWDALRSLASWPWFTRTWTIQEFVVANDASFVIGKIELPWQFYLDGLAAANRHHLLFITPEGEMEWQALTKARGGSSALRLLSLRQDQRSSAKIPLIELLRAHSANKVSEPRDKLFALRGLATDAHAPTLNPDYTSSLEQIFHKYARHMVLENQSLEVLSQAGTSRQTISLPSWVPDWSEHGVHALTIGYGSAPSYPPMILGIDGNILKLRGILLHKVEHTGLPVDPTEVLREVASEGSGVNTIKFTNVPKEWLLLAYRTGVQRYQTYSGRTGISSREVKAGDFITLLYGAETLFILRKVDTSQNTFKLISDCSIHQKPDILDTSQEEDI
jgi:Heterokaryon incompatibility protein (HET)